MNPIRRRLAALAGVAAFSVIAMPAALADDIPLAPAGATDVVGVAWDGRVDRLFVADATGSVKVLEDSGKLIGEVGFAAEPTDVEALAIRGEYLYIGDVGDRQRDREFVTVYRVLAEEGDQSYRAWDFEYPDGPRDAKAMAVSGRGRIYIVTDGDDPGIYRSETDPSRKEVNELKRVMDAPAGVSDAVFLPDGSTLALRTGDGVALIDAISGQTTDTLTYVNAPAGESITQFGDRRMLVGGAAGMRDEPLPDGNTTATPMPSATATGSPSPQPTPSPSAAPTGQAEEEDVVRDENQGVNRQGTILALCGALAVAVLAGAVTFIRD